MTERKTVQYDVNRLSIFERLPVINPFGAYCQWMRRMTGAAAAATAAVSRPHKHTFIHTPYGIVHADWLAWHKTLLLLLLILLPLPQTVPEHVVCLRISANCNRVHTAMTVARCWANCQILSSATLGSTVQVCLFVIADYCFCFNSVDDRVRAFRTIKDL